VVGQSQIVVQTPGQDFLATELHFWMNLPFELGEHEITMSFFTILAQRAHVGVYLIKNIHVNKFLIISRAKVMFFKYYRLIRFKIIESRAGG
jgi:hypothetical protein